MRKIKKQGGGERNSKKETQKQNWKKGDFFLNNTTQKKRPNFSFHTHTQPRKLLCCCFWTVTTAAVLLQKTNDNNRENNTYTTLTLLISLSLRNHPLFFQKRENRDKTNQPAVRRRFSKWRKLLPNTWNYDAYNDEQNTNAKKKKVTEYKWRM